MSMSFGQASARLVSLEDHYLPNRWVPFMAAMAFHAFLVIWDPTILKAGQSTLPIQAISVRMMDHLPVMEPPKPAHQRALMSLDALSEAQLPAQGRWREYYFRLSEILRKYLGERFDFDALECTTEELSECL